MKKFILYASMMLSLFILILNQAAYSEEGACQEPPFKIYKEVPDLVVVRPITTAAALVPTAAFLATLPATYVTGYDLKAATFLVEKPWGYATNRPLGVFLPKNCTKIINEEIVDKHKNFLSRTNADKGNLDIR